VTNCYVGIDPTGEVAKPNGLRGIAANSNVYITHNVISGNARSGIFLTNGAVDSFITDNLIGVSPTGADLGNGASGIYLGPGTIRVQVHGNTIAHNHDFGIAIDKASLEPAVDINSIYDNGGEAVDMGLDGPTAAPDFFAMTPAITDAHYDAASGETVVAIHSGDLAPPNIFQFLRVFVYATPELNRAGFAEAKTFLVRADLKDGDAVVRVPADLRGQLITAIAYRLLFSFQTGLAAESTSEVSLGVRVR